MSAVGASISSDWPSVLGKSARQDVTNLLCTSKFRYSLEGKTALASIPGSLNLVRILISFVYIHFGVRFEVSTAVTMKNVVFWDIKRQFILHRRHITSPLQSSASKCYVRFEVFTAVTMKNAVFSGL
jgi:hypothetical protein